MNFATFPGQGNDAILATFRKKGNDATNLTTFPKKEKRRYEPYDVSEKGGGYYESYDFPRRGAAVVD